MKGNLLPPDLGPGPIKKPNYPPHRASYKGRGSCFRWRKCPEGCLAMTSLLQFVEDRLATLQITTGKSFAAYGITEQTTDDFLRRAVPEVFERYERDMGRPMPFGLAMGRVYMWYLTHKGKGKGCKKAVSEEHPSSWATTAELAAGLERWVRAG